jgi:two-component system phosphate regulon response regulator PhoB
MATMLKKKVLIVEDEEDIRELVAFHLARDGLYVSGVASGEAALDRVRNAPVDLLILDLMLPGIDGLEVARRMKSSRATRDILILMLTARGAEKDVIEGLNAGADDYVVKPFSPKVLSARVRALLREWSPIPRQTDTIQVHDLVINAGKRKVQAGGRPIKLTYTEFQILKLLAERPGWVFDRAQIVDAVRGDGFQAVGRSVDVQIVGLRKKLGQRGCYIETVRGVGYRLREKEPGP